MAASQSPVRLPDPPAPMLASLPDDLLAVILIRLPTLADLGRACTVCVAFHRVISGHSFLRRLRALHPLPLLSIATTIPAQPPYPCATLARAITPATAADLSHPRTAGISATSAMAVPSSLPISEFAVCDPLHRRYRLLPAIPDDLAALGDQSDIVRFNPFLAPYDEDEGGTSFRVIRLVQCQIKLIYSIFSSAGGSWHAGEFDGWRALITGSDNPAPGFEPELSTRSYKNGCFCWVMQWSHKFLMLDTRTMDFSSVDIPHSTKPLPRAIVEAAGGKFEMFTLCVDVGNEQYALFYIVLQNDGKNAARWLMEAFIPLPLKYSYNINGVAGGYLLLQGIPERPTFIPCIGEAKH